MFDYSNLYGLMAQKGVTRKMLAEKIGMARTYFCTILRQGNPMTSDVVYRIANTLGIDSTEIGFYFFVLKV